MINLMICCNDNCVIKEIKDFARTNERCRVYFRDKYAILNDMRYVFVSEKANPDRLQGTEILQLVTCGNTKDYRFYQLVLSRVRSSLCPEEN